MITEDLKAREFLAGMEQLGENGRNYISGLTRSLFLVENPDSSEIPAEHPMKLPLEPPKLSVEAQAENKDTRPA